MIDRATKIALALENGSVCRICGARMKKRGRHAPTVDHIIPKAAFHDLIGQEAAHLVDSRANLVVICAKCNVEKGNRTFLEWIKIRAYRGEHHSPEAIDWMVGKYKSAHDAMKCPHSGDKAKPPNHT